MAITIREMQAQDVDPLVRLLEGASDGASSTRIDPNLQAHLRKHQALSIVAYAGERLVGAVLCQHDQGRGHTGHIILDDESGSLVKTLIDKMLLKLSKRGIHKCGFLLPGEQGGGGFWDSVAWSGKNDMMRRRTTAP